MMSKLSTMDKLKWKYQGARMVKLIREGQKIDYLISSRTDGNKIRLTEAEVYKIANYYEKAYKFFSIEVIPFVYYLNGKGAIDDDKLKELEDHVKRMKEMYMKVKAA